MPDLTLGDILAASGGGYDPYADPSGGTITLGEVLRAVGHQVAPAWIDPQQSPLTARQAVEQTSAQTKANKPPDPLEVMLGVAGGPNVNPAMFIGPIGIRRFAAAGMPEYQAALDKALGLRAKGVPEADIYQQTRIGEGPGISFQHGKPFAESPGLGTGLREDADLPTISGGKGGYAALHGPDPNANFIPSEVMDIPHRPQTVTDIWK